MNLIEVVALIGTVVAIVVILAVHYAREARDLPEFDDRRTMDRQRDTLDRLGCAAGHHRWLYDAPCSKSFGHRIYQCSVCGAHDHTKQAA